VALCERIGGQVEAERAAWQEPEPIVDDPMDEPGAEVPEMERFLEATGVRHVPV
jgi:hypothetical protein